LDYITSEYIVTETEQNQVFFPTNFSLPTTAT